MQLDSLDNTDTLVAQVSKLSSAREFINREVALMSGFIAQMLRERFSDSDPSLSVAITFLELRYKNYFQLPINHQVEEIQQRIRAGRDLPLQRLADQLQLSALELNILLLAGMAEHHEGYADIFRSIHPTHQPYPSAALAAQLFCPDQLERSELRELLQNGSLVNFGLIKVVGDGPLLNRSLVVSADLWSLLEGTAIKPEFSLATTEGSYLAGLDEWLVDPLVEQAKYCLQHSSNCHLIILSDNTESALYRSMALCQFTGRDYLPIVLNGKKYQSVFSQLLPYCLAGNFIPVFKVQLEAEQESIDLSEFPPLPGPAIFCCQPGEVQGSVTRLNIHLQLEKLSAAATKNMWSLLVPELLAHSAELAARYPVEPYQASKVSREARTLAAQQKQAVTVQDIEARFKNNSCEGISNSVQLIKPKAGWSQLILPDNALQQLKDAAERLKHQAIVLDDWKFLSERRGSRGVRMLLSGPPGTGKSLSAEVLAKELNVDMLVVDLSSVVSKWIGETEKNLAKVFNQAEKVKAALFFDEADSLFGKRTEVSDAHDRYANLETSYLLTRLERYDGLTILATNYRKNIDNAFLRRLDFLIEYREPSVEERVGLWRAHVPDTAPLADDVNFEELAGLFPIVGGLVRNAAVSAAYFAAQEKSAINRAHFIRAIRREYEKSGKAFREVNL